jgi:uncharacterized repeat protein (TIGR03843 family)
VSVTAVDPDLLEGGELRLLGLLPRASNYTFLGEITGNGGTVRVVYKPRDGEIPLWDFPEGTLCQREVAAYLVARRLGWPNVPPTILRDGPHGEGSVQLFVDHDPAEHYFTVRERRPDDLRAIAAFDVVVGNGDRKAGHCLEGRDGNLWVVDHGLCFAEDPELRTVIWEFAGEPVPTPLLEAVGRLSAELRGGPLREELAGLLTSEEILATAERASALVASGTYPFPGPGRSQPWPPV